MTFYHKTKNQEESETRFNKILNNHYVPSDLLDVVNSCWENLPAQERKQLADYIYNRKGLDLEIVLAFVVQVLKEKSGALEAKLKRRKSPLGHYGGIRNLLQYHREYAPSALWLDAMKNVFNVHFINSKNFVEYVNNIRQIQTTATATEASLKELTQYLVKDIAKHFPNCTSRMQNLLLVNEKFFELLEKELEKEENLKGMSYEQVSTLIDWKVLSDKSALDLMEQLIKTPSKCYTYLKRLMSLRKIVDERTLDYTRPTRAKEICYTYAMQTEANGKINYNYNFCEMLFMIRKDVEPQVLKELLLLIFKDSETSHSAMIFDGFMKLIYYYEIKVNNGGFEELRELFLQEQKGYTSKYDYDLFNRYVTNSFYYGWKEGATIMATTYHKLAHPNQELPN